MRHSGFATEIFVPQNSSSRLTMLSRRRRFVFTVAGVLLVSMVIESISAIGLYYSFGAHESFEGLAEQQEWLSKSPRDAEDSGVVVHPFTGWCIDPQVSQGDEAFGKKIPVNRLGFVDDQETIQWRNDDRLVIGITGGSVAWQLSVGADTVIREVVKESPDFREREVIVLRIGQSGYKQPQQLMTVNWLMALGGEFDAIVNLDGYNELALTMAENYKRNIHTAYPRAWNVRMQELVDPRKSAARMRLLELDASRQLNARCIRQAPWKWSFTANAVWKLSDRLAQREKVDYTKELLENHLSREGLPFVESGPIQQLADTDAVLNVAADLWLRASIQMHRVLDGADIVYLHALQPNLHHTGSKPISDEETILIGGADQTRSRAINSGYPLLLHRRSQLDEAGVSFLDLSTLFADESRTMYVDRCCHLNQEGNRRLAVAIAVRLRELLEESLSN